jgi:hypothetical protein
VPAHGEKQQWSSSPTVVESGAMTSTQPPIIAEETLQDEPAAAGIETPLPRPPPWPPQQTGEGNPQQHEPAPASKRRRRRRRATPRPPRLYGQSGRRITRAIRHCPFLPRHHSRPRKEPELRLPRTRPGPRPFIGADGRRTGRLQAPTAGALS